MPPLISGLWVAGGVHWGSAVLRVWPVCDGQFRAGERALDWVTPGHGLSECWPEELNVSRTLPACFAPCLADSPPCRMLLHARSRLQQAWRPHATPVCPLSPGEWSLGLCKALGFPRHGLAFGKNSTVLALLNTNPHTVLLSHGVLGLDRGTQKVLWNFPIHPLYLPCLEYSLVFSGSLIIAC